MNEHSPSGAFQREDAGDAVPFGRAAPVGNDRVERIYHAIRQAVLEQKLPPGTRLPEDQLGGTFGASRTLVRAALQALGRDGIVVQIRNRGAFVASPTPQDARDLFEARRVVEAVTVARAALKAGTNSLAELQAMLVEGQEAIASGDRGRAIRLSGGFHLQIATIAGQRILSGFLKDLVARSSLVIALYGNSRKSDCGDAEHSELLAALARHDPDTAVALMTEHLHHIEADLDLSGQGVAPVSLIEVFGERVGG